MSALLNNLLTQPDQMSRFIYLLHTLGLGLCQTVLILMMISGHAPANANMMLGILGGGTFLGGVARAATKAAGIAPTTTITAQPQIPTIRG